MIFEMALLRLIETRPFKKIDELIEKINQAENHFVEPNQNFPTDSNVEENRPVSTLAKNNASVSWAQIKQQVARKKPFLEHYLEKCKVLVFNEKEIHLSFSDQFTFDLVETPENIECLKENIKTVSGYDVDINLILDPSKKDQDVPLEGKKKVYRH